MSKVGRIGQFGKNTIHKISTQTNRYGQKHLQSIVVNTSRAVLQDAKQTIKYYKIKATRGWVEGKVISDKRRLSKPIAFMVKTGYAVKEGAKNIQRKDVLPVIGAGIGACTPILGAWVVGFVAGKCLNKISNTLGKCVKQLGKNLRHL